MVCLNVWNQDVQTISLFLRPALIKQLFYLTYSYKIWQQLVFKWTLCCYPHKRDAAPSQFVFSIGQVVQMECGESGHRWLGCRAFFADKHILCDQTVRVTDRFGFSNAVVTPVALCGAGHRPSHKRHSQTMDCVFRKQTQIVGSFYGSMFDLPIRFASGLAPSKAQRTSKRLE